MATSHELKMCETRLDHACSEDPPSYGNSFKPSRLLFFFKKKLAREKPANHTMYPLKSSGKFQFETT